MANGPRFDLPPRAVTLDADDALPRVEPPSAAFLVQLFVVPGIIVSIIVFVWLAFHWLAQLGNDPEAYVRTLRRASEGRWQAALNLANELRGPGGGTLKQNAKLAGELAAILATEIESGRLRGGGNSAEQSRTLCGYLCRALGEFAVPEAAGPLLARAADVEDLPTTRAAVEALSVLATNLTAAGRRFDDPAAVVATVIGCSQSPDAPLRSAAAFTLGVLGGNDASARLVEMLDDGGEDVRFNAAVGLARQGRAESWGTIAEMLALPDEPAAADDQPGQAKRYRRVLIVVNALKAAGLILDETAVPPPGEITDRISGLARDPVGDVRSAATALTARIDRLPREPATVP